MNMKRNLLLTLMALIIGGSILYIQHRPLPAPVDASWADAKKEAEAGGYRLITTEELAARYQQEPHSLLLVDTRQDWEFMSGYIQGALNFPIEPTWWGRWRAEKPLAALLGPDKNLTVVFYWAGLAWVRSDAAARVAVQLGYKNVYRDPLGYPAWQEQGLPVASAPREVAETGPALIGSFLSWSMLWTLLGVFAGGMALNLTPCVYPLIPITVSYFGGLSEGNRRRLVGHGLAYMAGLSVTNTVLGVVAALTGGLMGAMLQNPVVLLLIATILLVFAASMFGFWELRLPQSLTQAAAKSYAGFFGSLFMGLTLGLVAAPCIGPFVLGLLTWVASQGSAWLGFAVFFTLSLGLGLPLFFLAMFSGSLEKLPRSGEWMIWVRKLMGWVLVGLAIHFLRPLLPGSWGIILLGLIALAAGVHLAFLDRTTASFRAFPWLKSGTWFAGLLIAMLLVGSWALRGPGVSWQPYSEAVLEEATKQHKPVIMDFTATWCSPCRELDEITFHHPDVVGKAAKEFVMVKVDLTQKGDPRYARLLQEYNVKGVPTVVFLDAQGREITGLRLVDYLPPDRFLLRMVQAKKSEP